jgi:hypothetical protein
LHRLHKSSVGNPIEALHNIHSRADLYPTQHRRLGHRICRINICIQCIHPLIQ